MNKNRILRNALYDERNRYKGRDGRSYSTLGQLETENEAWRRQYFPFIGMDGQDYPTSEELIRANAEWKLRTFPKK